MRVCVCVYETVCVCVCVCVRGECAANGYTRSDCLRIRRDRATGEYMPGAEGGEEI